MYPATAALSALLDGLLHKPIEALTLAQIQARRGQAYPARPPFSWVTGAIDRSVGITFGTAPARDGYEIPMRLYRPRAVPDTDTDVPVILFFHGGGWVQGNVVMYDPLCSHLAARVRAVVVSVDYRLAPEHQAPTAAYDAIDAASWICAHGAVLRADAGRTAVCGDSAGGTLAAIVAQDFRDRFGSRASPLRHQALIYPATDLTMASRSIDELAEAPLLTRRSIVAFREHYAPEGTDWTDPLLSPLFGDLAGLPPALIQTADLDPIRDDGIRYGEALEVAGVQVRLTNYVRAPHGFASFPGVFAAASQHRSELFGELRRHLYGSDAPLPAPGG
jgi:acetyl esterase